MRRGEGAALRFGRDTQYDGGETHAPEYQFAAVQAEFLRGGLDAQVHQGEAQCGGYHPA